MNALIELLRCPYCGDRLTLHETASTRDNGILCCACCAFPMVDGIPYLRTGATAEHAMRLLGEGKTGSALLPLLGLPDEQRQAFDRLLERDPPATFRECLALLCPGPEGDYLFHRFSDPTFVCSEAVVQTLAQDPRCMRRVLDVCGGAGHLTRTLCENSTDVILADLSFAKLWLARRFIAPACRPVCCDAGEPLPFARGVFSLVHCCDAFHYIWRRRSLASEMMRLLDDSGVVALTHLHNLLGDNISAGMPLTPAVYRELFHGLRTTIFKESDLFEAMLRRSPIEFADGCRNEELTDEAALILLATPSPTPFRVVQRPAAVSTRRLAKNPLYVVERNDAGETWTLHFPSAGYELEFANARRYLPTQVQLIKQDLDDLHHGRPNDRLTTLAERRVLLDLPDGYEQW